jgi:hypothetical protein
VNPKRVLKAIGPVNPERVFRDVDVPLLIYRMRIAIHETSLDRSTYDYTSRRVVCVPEVH